jgi:hypothetical protein
MPQLSFSVDDTLLLALQQGAKNADIPLSRYIRNLLQRALVSDANLSNNELSLMQPKLLGTYKKLLAFSVENLALTQYLVNNLGEGQFKNANEITRQKAFDHAVSYVAGLFEE